MDLNDVNSGIEKHRKPLRLGRGIGTGQGKTAGRGHKGQSSHNGWSSPAAFQGGMSPLVRRIPKRGFHNAFAANVGAVNVGEFDEVFNAGDEVNAASLRKTDLLKGRFDEIKILGGGELTKKLKVVAHRFSASAKEKIEKAGGEAVVLPAKKPVEKNKMVVKKKKA